MSMLQVCDALLEPKILGLECSCLHVWSHGGFRLCRVQGMDAVGDRPGVGRVWPAVEFGMLQNQKVKTQAAI